VLILLLTVLLAGYAIKAAGPNTSNNPTPSASVHSTTSSTGSATNGSTPTSGAVALSSLPRQARDTVALIQAGGPYPYSRDGVVFGNNERRLPIKPRGYYHEYTVNTPGEGDRGARRIIMGENGEVYYTGDHYDSFVLVDVDR